MRKIIDMIVSALEASGNKSGFVLFESNRLAHIVACLLGSAAFGWGFGIGAGLAAEAKDLRYGGRWDWLDIAADAVGTLLGGIVHFAIFNCW